MNNTYKSTLAPVVLFVYNRPDHLSHTVQALSDNLLADKTELIIISDGPRSTDDVNQVNAVREYIQTIRGFKSVRIVTRDSNLGLADNIIDGVTKVAEEFGKVIVLEDDLLTSPWFLKYMNDGLNKYMDSDRVISIHGYVYPVRQKLPETFFLKGADCWGWATWKEKWDLFEPDGKKLLKEIENRNLTGSFDFDNSYPYTEMLRDQINGKVASWAIRWYATAFLNNMLTLYPGVTLVNHIGGDGSGTNSGIIKKNKMQLTDKQIVLSEIDITQNVKAREVISNFLRNSNASFAQTIYRKIKKYFKVFN